MVVSFPRTGFIFIGLAMLQLCGCALLFPDRTAPKSQQYVVTPPATPWHKLATSEDPNSTDAMKADIAYENPESGAIISLNSICRKYSPASLDTLTSNLVRGIPERDTLQRKEIQLAGSPALDTLFSGLVDNVRLHIRTVVLVKNSCSYDFIYVSVPKREEKNGAAFDTFLASFRTE
jgi:hypothetical protein